MRTTLDIDEDVLQAAKELAMTRRSTAGKILSELARKGLQPSREHRPETRNGVPLLPAKGEEGFVTLEEVNRLRDGD